MRALLYANTDGIANRYHGSGVQTRVLLDAWKEVKEKLTRSSHDEWHLHVAVHDWEIPSADYRIDQAVLQESLEKASERAIRIHRLQHDSRTMLWSYPKWAELSSAAAGLLSRLADEYDQVVFIGVDVPYALVQEFCARTMPQGKLEKIVFALSFHTSALVEGQTWIPGREALERDYVRRANSGSTTFLTTLTPYFDRKLARDYDVHEDAWLTLGHGIAPHSQDMSPYSLEKAGDIVDTFGIPRSTPILVHFGRDHPMKRIPFAIEAVARVDRPCHLVLVAATTANMEGVAIEPHARQLSEQLTSYTYLTHFERDLPKALARLPETAAFLLSAEGEPMGQIPQEIACWAGESAVPVVAPADGGYSDQVKDTETGFTFDVHSVDSFARAIERAMDAPLYQRKAISAAMKDQVHHKFDASTNLYELLTSIEAGTYGARSRVAQVATR